MKKLLAMLLALVMCACLFAGCGTDNEKDTENTQPVASDPVNEPAQEDTGLAPGTFSFTYVDVYGDETAFTVTIKDTGKVYVMYDGALGKATLNGDGWTDNGDGSFTTGTLSGELPVDWAGADGSVTWQVDGEAVTPAGYTAPTEFIEKPYTDPTNMAEAVGVYTFGYVNAYGVTVPYILWLNADGTFDIYENSNWVGLMHYYGDSWTVNGDSVAALGPCSYDGEPPRTAGNGATWFAEDTYESSWKLSGDKTCVPVGYEGDVGELELTTLPAECYPAGAEYAGVYTFGYVNNYGVTVPYILWLNADGSFDIYENSNWVGLMHYYGESWTAADGVAELGACAYDAEPPRTEGNGATWFAEGTYESTWTLNTGSKTAVPVGYEKDPGQIDLTTLPAECYPAAATVAGTYYFGFVNPYGATTPYAVKLKDDGAALIIMDSTWVGAQSYTGSWTQNDDGTIFIGGMSWEGEAPKTAGNGATWFADDTYESTWTLDGGSCVPVNYDGSIAEIDRSSFTDGALAALEAF